MTMETSDLSEDFVLLSFSLVAFDLSTEEVLRAGVRKSIASFNSRSDDGWRWMLRIMGTNCRF